MFGYVTANYGELSKAQRERYGSIYCGICRGIRDRASQTARLGLSYDMAFLAMLHMSLYEPEEASGKNACLIHPLKKRSWVDGPCVSYAADMNVALSYYKALDDWRDDGSLTGKALASVLEKHMEPIRGRWPRQLEAIQSCIGRLSQLEKENCSNPDEPAGVFGELMGELLVCEEDLWAPNLRKMGDALGRFIYLLDAMLDYDRDEKKGKYNPFLAMGTGKQEKNWEEYLVLTMGRCTDHYERLPLVQDKDILDNILYSGVWTFRARKKGESHDHGSL